YPMIKVSLCVLGLAVLLALHCAVDAQVPQVKRGAQVKKSARPTKSIRPTRVVRAKGVKRSLAVRPNAAVNDVLTYTNAGGNIEDGQALSDTDGSRLRATRLRVWAPRVAWRASLNGAAITLPTGQGGSAPSNFRYPGCNIAGIVLSQPGSIPV